MILIKNGKILTMNGKNYNNGCILTLEGKIKEIGENIEPPKGCIIIDAKGGWVLPGFIESHCHIGIMEEDVGVEGRDVNEATDPITPQLRAIDAVNPFDSAFDDAVKAGITTVMTGPGSVNVIGGQYTIMKTKGNCVDSMVIKESAAVKAALGENPKRFYNSKNKMPMTRMGIAALLRETLLKAKHYRVKKILSENNNNDFIIDLKMEALIPVLEKKIPLKIHVHRADDILTAIRIAKEFDIKITLDHCTEGHLIPEYIKNTDIPAIIGPTMTSRSKIETKNKSFETAKILKENGVDIAIMTDHPVIPIEYLPICAALSVKAGLSLEDALKSITINAAKILGVENKIGSIEIGKDADICIYNGNPLEIFTKTLYTIIDGEIVYTLK